jgi:Thrombospondin C-terminal region
LFLLPNKIVKRCGMNYASLIAPFLERPVMSKLNVMLVSTLLACASGASMAAPVPIDLNTWNQRGPSANGTWTVAPGGASVLQSINGDPTFFVSPGTQINTTVRGTISVGSSGDDDFVGFVLGYNGPGGTGNNMNYILLDWKQQDQNFGGALAREGFSLNRVNGTITDYIPGFWGHTDTGPSGAFDVLATDFGSTRGWADNTTYDFSILYQSSRIKVDISGGAFGTGTTIFDFAGTFPDGQFGFYNYSQANVRYAGLTEEVTPPPPPQAGVPVPGTLVLLALGLSAMLRRGRAQ